MKNLYALAIASVALLTACGDDDDGPTGGEGSGYTATITGLPGITESSGNAFWTEGTEEGVTSFVIGLQPSNTAQVGFVIARTGAGRAAVGNYTFIDNETEPTPEQFQLFASLSPYICGAISGTHNITESGGSRVRGTFTIQGQCASTATQEPPVDVTITGTYNALKAPTSVSALSIGRANN